MTLNFFTLLMLFSVFITAILSLFFFINKKGSVSGNRRLAFILLVFNMQIIYSFMVSNFAFQFFIDWHKPIYLLKQTSFLIGPQIYFYVNSYLKRKDFTNSNRLLHFSPFIAVLIILMISYKKTDLFIIWKSSLNLYDTVLILVHNMVYLILCLYIINSMNISFRGLYKRINNSTNYSWLQILLLGFIVIWIVNLNSFALYMIIQKPSWCAYTGSIYALTVFLFVNLIMFLLLLKPDIYYIIEKYKNNKLSKYDKEEYLIRLNSYIEKEKAFLDPDISIDSVATAISVNPRILSQIVNETFGKNFKRYILELRLRDSMKLLADSNYHEFTILEILYKVGFNNKSAFNNQFKAYTKLTPREYRSQFLN